MRKLLAVAFLTVLPASVMAASGSVTLVNQAALPYSTTYPQNLQSFGLPQIGAAKLSAQVTFASATIANQTFFDGSQSTGSLTVVSTSTIVALTASDSLTVPSTAAILGSPATNQITVISTTGLAGTQATFTTALSNYSDIAATSPTITLNGLQSYTYGSATWASTDTIQHAAATLAAGINAGANYTAVVVNSTGVTITAAPLSTVANGWVVNSSSITDISTGTFSGGANPVTITITLPNQSLAFTYGANWISSDTVTHAAATLANVVNTGTTLDATNTAGVIYASATLIGIIGNSYTITTSSAALVSVSSSSFLGGLNPALLGSNFVLGANTYKRGLHWSDVSGTCSGTAASITAFINSVSTQGAVAGGGIENVIATQAGCVINLVTATKGAANNGIVLTSTGPYGSLTAATANFTGGQDNASITINGVNLAIGVAIAPPTASSTTANMATAFAAGINANTSLNTIITAQASGAVVTSTSNAVGNVNYTTVSSTPSQLTFANATMTGGTTAAITLNSATISLPSHGFTKAIPVLYTGTPAIGGLTTTTTYYVVPIDANDIQLAATSTGAVAGLGIVITSTNTQTSKDTYTLAPLTFTQGPAAAKWEVSNDGINWATYSTTAGNVAVSSQTFTPIFPSTTVVQDFGVIDYGWIRYNVTAPTQGGVTLKVILNAKD